MTDEPCDEQCDACWVGIRKKSDYSDRAMPAIRVKDGKLVYLCPYCHGHKVADNIANPSYVKP